MLKSDNICICKQACGSTGMKANYLFRIHKKVGKVFIPGLPAPSLTMSNQMPRPSTPLDSVSTPSKPLNKHLGPIEEVRRKKALPWKEFSCNSFK